VKAVKQGAVYLPYDTNFVFAEVNGDRVFWEVEESGQMKVIRVDRKCIGKMISTKAVGSDKRDDITHEYKHPEGKVEEKCLEKYNLSDGFLLHLLSSLKETEANLTAHLLRLGS